MKLDFSRKYLISPLTIINSWNDSEKKSWNCMFSYSYFIVSDSSGRPAGIKPSILMGPAMVACII